MFSNNGEGWNGRWLPKRTQMTCLASFGVFFIFFRAFLILTNVLYYIKALLMTERVGMGDDDLNWPK